MTGLIPALCVVFLAATPARGATFHVSSGADGHDARPGDHRCRTAAGECTLRAAIEEANATSGADTIRFTLGARATIVLANGQLEIVSASALRIKGPGAASLSIDGNEETRLFRVGPGAAATLSGLTLRHGFAKTDEAGGRGLGGSVENLGTLTLAGVTMTGNRAAEGGGAISNAATGTLRLIRSTLRGNSSGGAGGGLVNDGTAAILASTVAGNSAATIAGGILNNGALDLVESTLSDNTASEGGGGLDNEGSAKLTRTAVTGNTSRGRAGGLDNRGTLILVNSTVSGNNGLDDVGGIANFGALGLFSSTVCDNTSQGTGGIYGAGGEITIVNSLIAGNRGRAGTSDANADCAVFLPCTLGSRGNNLLGRDTGCAPGPEDVTVDPALVAGFLGPLQDNGGPTPTHALLDVTGNPALQWGDPAGCVDPEGLLLETDQRGEPRIESASGSGRCALGAFALGPPALSTGPHSRLARDHSFEDGGAAAASAAGVRRVPGRPAGEIAVATSATAPALSAVAYVGRVASATSSVSSSRATLTAGRPVAAGDTLLVAVLLTSASSLTGPVSATDAAGNVYTLDRDQNDGSASDRVLLLSCKNARALAAAATIVLSFPISAGLHVSVDEFAGLVALDRSASASGTGTTFSSGATLATTQPVELIFGLLGIESGVAPVWATGWTALPTLSVSSDRLGAAFQVSSAAGPFTSSGSASGTWMAAIATYTSGAPPENPPTASLSAAQLATPALTVKADASGSTDIDATPIGSYTFNFGDGTPTLVTTPPLATAQHTYQIAGTYTVTLTVTDTVALTSAPARATVVVSATVPVDNPPVAKLTVTKPASPPLTVLADASGSTDTDATGIASYTFNFGDATPTVTTLPPTATAAHTYLAGGTYRVEVTVADSAGKSAAASASVAVSATAGSQPVAVYAGYFDTHHPGLLKAKPDPWKGSGGVVFVGKLDSGGGWDTSAVRVDNLTGAPLTGVVVTVDIGSHHYALWGTSTIPAGGRLIVAQTSGNNFDGSDVNPAGCFGCNPTLCRTAVASTIPVVHVTIGGTRTDYFDRGQILNTHGVDSAGCPFTGSRNDESHDWQRLN